MGVDTARPPRPGRARAPPAAAPEGGRVADLKTFRLSEAQVRRGYLLRRLAEHDWRLGAAAALGAGRAGLALRLERAGFGYLLRQDVLDHFRAQRRAT